MTAFGQEGKVFSLAMAVTVISGEKNKSKSESSKSKAKVSQSIKWPHDLDIKCVAYSDKVKL